MKVAGRWRYLYRAIDPFGQVIDVDVSSWRDTKPAHRFFEQAIGTTKITPAEVSTDQAPVYPAVLEELPPASWRRSDRYANHRVEGDHGRLKARLGPMRGRKPDPSARVVIAGHALVQNLRRGHYELAVAEPHQPARGGRIPRTGLGDLIPADVGLQPALGRCNATAPPGLDPAPPQASSACWIGGRPVVRPSGPSALCRLTAR